MSTCEPGDARTWAASAWKYQKNRGTLGTSSTGVEEIPHDIMERCVVPMLKHMTSAFCGAWSRKASDTADIILVIGVSTVIPTPLTSKLLCLP